MCLKKIDLKVLHVSGAKAWGGNEQQLMYLIDELPTFKVHQVMFCFEGTPLCKEAAAHPVKIRAVKRVKPYSSAYRKALRKIVKEEKIDLIHLHTSDSVTGFVVTDILKPLNVPTVFAKKGIREKNSFLSKFKYNYHNIDRIICISEYVRINFKAILKKRNHSKLVTVYNGIKEVDHVAEGKIDLRKKIGIADDVILFGSIANHTRAKDLMTLVQSVDHLLKKGKKNFHMVQMGSFSKITPEFQAEVKNLGIGSHFSFLGFVENALSHMPQLDALVISSQREGGPSSLMEAFSRKTPVISTRVGIVEEVITDGENGFSVEVGEAEALADKMAHFMEDPSLADEFAQRSYEKYTSRFTAKHLGENTFRVYKELLLEKER